MSRTSRGEQPFGDRTPRVDARSRILALPFRRGCLFPPVGLEDTAGGAAQARDRLRVLRLRQALVGGDVNLPERVLVEPVAQFLYK